MDLAMYHLFKNETPQLLSLSSPTNPQTTLQYTERQRTWFPASWMYTVHKQPFIINSLCTFFTK